MKFCIFTPFLYFKKEGKKEGNVLFNDALNTFYLRLYGVRHMVKAHSDSGRGNLLPPHRLLFPISSKGSFISTIPDRIVHTMAFVTTVVEHWLEQEIALWVHPMKDRSDDPTHYERTLLPRSYISLLYFKNRSYCSPLHFDPLAKTDVCPSSFLWFSASLHLFPPFFVLSPFFLQSHAAFKTD